MVESRFHHDRICNFAVIKSLISRYRNARVTIGRSLATRVFLIPVKATTTKVLVPFSNDTSSLGGKPRAINSRFTTINRNQRRDQSTTVLDPA